MAARDALVAFCEHPDPDPDGILDYDPDALGRLTEDALLEDGTLNRILFELGWDSEGADFSSNVDLATLRDKLTVKSAGPQYVGIKFCQECNNMLFPTEDRGSKVLNYTCRNCPFEEPATNNCIYVNRITRDVDTLTQVNKDVASDPTLPHTRGNMLINCPKCGYDDAVFFQALSNRDQSGMQLYYVCCDDECGYKWCE